MKAQKELRQLQEDKKNDKKPPPYKHIKVRASGRGQVQKRSLELLVQVIYRYIEKFLLFGHLAALKVTLVLLASSVILHRKDSHMHRAVWKMDTSNRGTLIYWSRSGHLCAVPCQLCALRGASLYLGNLRESANNMQYA